MAFQHDPNAGATNGVVVSDIDIPFVRLVVIFIKVYLAMIPALILVSLAFAVIMSIIGGVFGFGAMMFGPMR